MSATAAEQPDPDHMTINLSIEHSHWNALPDPHGLVDKAARVALDVAGRLDTKCSVDIVLADDEAVKVLNQDWRNKSSATNVLSFPAAPVLGLPQGAGRMLGDIILASGVVQAEAEADGKTFATHTCHLIIHGMLHLLGFDHDNDTTAEQMEQLEIAAMERLGLPDPYQTEPGSPRIPLVM